MPLVTWVVANAYCLGWMNNCFILSDILFRSTNVSRWVHASVHNYIHDGCDDIKNLEKLVQKVAAAVDSKSCAITQFATWERIDISTTRVTLLLIVYSNGFFNSPTMRNQLKVTGSTPRGVHGCTAFALSRLATSIGKRIWHPAMCCAVHLCQWQGSVSFF